MNVKRQREKQREKKCQKVVAICSQGLPSPDKHTSITPQTRGKQAQITPLFPALLLHIQKPPTVSEHLQSLRATVESTIGDDAENIVTSACKIIRSNNAAHIVHSSLKHF